MENVIANPSPEKVIARTSECMRRLMEAGLTLDDLQRPIDCPKMRERLVRFWRHNGFEPSMSQEQVSVIMGQNFFGIEEAIKHFGVNPSKRQLAYLAEVPFTKEVLVACKDTHALVAVFPMSILDLRDHVSDKGLFYKQDWYNQQAFAKNKGEVGWQLVRKVPVADSTSKNWDEQQTLLSKDESTPKAQIVVYTMIGRFLAIGERLFEKVYVRCSDLSSDGYRVVVGGFDGSGLDVSRWSDDDRFSHIGLSAARKF